MSIEGLTEPVQHGILPGWVWDTDKPDAVQYVEAFDGEGFYRRVAANGFRHDLELAGKRSGYCLFAVPLPDGLENPLHLLLDGTGHRLNTWPVSIPGVAPDWLETEGAALRANLLTHRLTWSVLNRPATAAELVDAAARTGDAHALTGLVRTLLAQVPPPEPAKHESPAIDEIVRQAYLGVLRREAEPAGIEIYGHALRSGMSLSQLVRELIQTPEFAAAQPSGNTGGDLKELTRAMKAVLATLMLQGVPGGSGDAMHPWPGQPGRS